MDRAGMAQRVVIELQSGRRCRMDFDMGALAHAECVYEERFGKPVGVDAIIAELLQAKARAVMAFAYGAMLSAGEKLTWQDFAKSVYTYANYKRLSEAVLTALVCMMRSEEGDEGGKRRGFPWRGLKRAYMAFTGRRDLRGFWKMSPAELFAWSDALREEDDADLLREVYGDPDDGEVIE